MSLKTVHVVFITICTLGLLSFGFWGGREYRGTHASADLAWCIVGFAGAGVALCYGLWFLKKLQRPELRG